MKIFELTIDELDDWTGMDGLALVENPAIESNFYAFNNKQLEDFIAFETIKLAVKELFVEKRPGESKEDYVSRCIPVLIDEGYDADQAAGICYSSFKFDETEDVYELEIGGYSTRHYDMCPGATAIYRKIESGEIDTDMGLAIRAAKLQDVLFWLEKHTVKQMQSASFEDVVAAQNLAAEILELARMMGLEEEHQYIPGHVQAIIDVYRGSEELDIDVTGLPDYTNETSGSYQFESYTDYPKQATENAKIALRWVEENGWGDCATPVGKARANQLAKGEPISEETIARMAAFARHRENGQKELGDGCGRLSWLSWGGDAGVDWAQRKLKQIRQEQSSVSLSKQGSFKFAVDSDQRRLVGGVAIPDKLIMRIGEDGEPYYVYFSKNTIRELAYKFMRNKFMDNVNLEHDPEQKVDATLEETWLIEDPKTDKANTVYDLSLPTGSWVAQYRINDDKVWDMVKRGEVRGLSLEGYFSDKYIQG